MNKPLDSTVAAARRRRGPLAGRSTPRRSAPTRPVRNRSGIAIKPLYTPRDWSGERYDDDARLSRASRRTRAASTPTMHRGRTWTQRQLIGLGTPADYNARLLDILAQGAHRRVADPLQLGVPRLRHGRGRTPSCSAPAAWSSTPSTTWTPASPASTSRRTSCAMNDPSPFTLLAFLLATAKRRGVAWDAITGTSNQSDYLSPLRRQPHVLPHRAARRAARSSATTSTSATGTCRAGTRCRWSASTCSRPARRRPRRWPSRSPPRSRTPTTASRAAWTPTQFLPRFTFFFDISMSFFEEVAQVPRRPPHLGAHHARALRREGPAQLALQVPRARPPASTSRAQQPLNNIARVTVQAMAGILGGLQSLHTDAYDEALSCPTEFGARIAVATQNILREEAHLTDVIDPLGGSYYVETLTDQMEAEILRVDAARRGRRRHVRGGRGGPRPAEDRRVGAALPGAASSPARRRSSASTRYQVEEDRSARPALAAPDPREACARISRRSPRSRRRARRQAVATRARRARPRRERSDGERLRRGRRGRRSRLHARRDLRHAAPRDGLRPRAGDRLIGHALEMNAALPRELSPLDAGDRRAIARAISAIENDEPGAAALARGDRAAPRPRARRSASPARRARASRR